LAFPPLGLTIRFFANSARLHFDVALREMCNIARLRFFTCPVMSESRRFAIFFYKFAGKWGNFGPYGEIIQIERLGGTQPCVGGSYAVCPGGKS